MKLEEGLILSTEIIKVLYPFCERVAVAGSIRRMRPQVKDIDIVLIPKPTLGSWQQLLLKLQKEYKAKVLKKGEKYCQLKIRGVNIDIYRASSNNWGSVLLRLTGPWKWNEFLARRAIRMGLSWTAMGILKEDRVIAGKTEKDIFKALNIEYVEPKDRK